MVHAVFSMSLFLAKAFYTKQQSVLRQTDGHGGARQCGERGRDGGVGLAASD